HARGQHRPPGTSAGKTALGGLRPPHGLHRGAVPAPGTFPADQQVIQRTGRPFHGRKPAISASSAVRNQTSASISSYTGESGVWYWRDAECPFTCGPFPPGSLPGYGPAPGVRRGNAPPSSAGGSSAGSAAGASARASSSPAAPTGSTGRVLSSGATNQGDCDRCGSGCGSDWS